MEIDQIYSLKTAYLKDKLDLKDEELQLALIEAKQKILNFCHRTDIPTGLLFTWANIARDLLIYWNYGLYPQEVEESGGIGNLPLDPSKLKRISIGDTTVEMSTTPSTGGGGYTSTKKVDEEIDDFLRNYVNELRVFRKLVHKGTYYG